VRAVDVEDEGNRSKVKGLDLAFDL